MENKSYGQISYEAYCGHTNWKSLVTGQELPMWENLKDEIKEAWEVTGQTLITYYEDYLLREFLDRWRDDN